eukprot:8660937-Pyramimonas_sp.AAC.2
MVYLSQYRVGTPPKKDWLVEKKLDPKKKYTKWNGNNGFVDGQGEPPAVGLDQPLANIQGDVWPEKASLHGLGEFVLFIDCFLILGHCAFATAPKLRINKLQHRHLGALLAEESEEDEDEDEDENTEPDILSARGPPISIANADIPQAFTCFTYRQSRRRMMVCDL